MKKSTSKLLDSTTMRTKLTAVLLVVILLPMLLLAYFSYRVIDSHLEEEIHEKVGIGLRSAWSEYYVRGEQMRYGMLQGAATEEIRKAVASKDVGYLKNVMSRWKQMRPYVDIWAIVDADGRVMTRLGSAAAGDILDLNGLVGSSLVVGEPIISSEVLTKDVLRKEASAINGAPGMAGAQEGLPDEALALLVVTPVLDANRKVTGAIVTGDIINNDSFIVDTVADKLPGFYTSVSLRGVRITTNLADSSGKTATSTRLPDKVTSELASGKRVYGEVDLPGMTYMSVYEPIKNNRGEVIGSLGVSVSKDWLWHIQSENQWVIGIITLLGVSFSLLSATLLTYRITRPLTALKEKISAFAAGDMSVRAVARENEGLKDELDILAVTFNSMMDDVSMRAAEKEKYLKEIEEKNTALVTLNDELRATNEELEVAYEETQSQTEELHAINEELKLLNEDLDRKNDELKQANELIKKEEEELKKAKDMLRLIYDGITDFIMLVDGDLNVLEANRHLAETLSLPESRIIGRKVYGLFGLPERTSGCPIRRSLSSNKPAEAELTTPDEKVLMLYSYPLVSKDRRQELAVVYIKDVTEQRQLMQQLIRSDKLSSLGELVSGVAHELNNPLTGIMCFSELLLDDGLSDEVCAKVKKINDASHRCKKIIDNLLTFSRWHKPEKRYDDLNRIIRESVELRSYQLKVDNIEIKMQLDESLPKTMIDSNQIHQVFLNLINNARDAIVEGGGGSIFIRSSFVDGRAVVEFTDTGRGIPADLVDKVFDPFFTTKEVGKGTGLGLSISYGIINEHGGNIYAASKDGHGASFVVELPVAAPGPAVIDDGLEEGGQARLQKLAAKGLRALILDDEVIVQEIVNDTLRSSGFSVETANSGEEALVKIKSKDYDIVISDIKMPGLDGRGFYREVKAATPAYINKILFITGDSINRETQKFLEETGSFYLRKPFTVDQLTDAVSKLIG